MRTPNTAPAPHRRWLSSTLALGVGCALFATGTAAVALYAIPSLQLRHRSTVLAAAFIPYGLPAFAGAAVIFAAWRRRWVKPLAVAAVAGVFLQTWWARPYLPAPSPAPAPSQITLITMNLRCNPVGQSDLAALTERVRPDVLVVQGLTLSTPVSISPAWAGLLPYVTFHPMVHLPGCGTFVFSRTPLRALSGASDVQPVVEVSRPDGPFVLLPVDFPTPTGGVAPWLDAFTHLSAAATAHGGSPMVVAGDFNAVREHVPMRHLLQTTGLRDAAEVAGAGWTPTFPGGRRRPPLFALDHALTTPELEPYDVRTEYIWGQQHRALIARINMTRGETP